MRIQPQPQKLTLYTALAAIRTTVHCDRIIEWRHRTVMAVQSGATVDCDRSTEWRHRTL